MNRIGVGAREAHQTADAGAPSGLDVLTPRAVTGLASARLRLIARVDRRKRLRMDGAGVGFGEALVESLVAGKTHRVTDVVRLALGLGLGCGNGSRLMEQKGADLAACEAECVVTANIGCQLQLAAGGAPVRSLVSVLVDRTLGLAAETARMPSSGDGI